MAHAVKADMARHGCSWLVTAAHVVTFRDNRAIDPIRKWIADDARIPESAAKLLRLMVRLGLKPEDVK